MVAVRRKMNSLVSIGITAFNAQDTIERAVASALAQSWRPIEVVVVDDCSSDGTLALLEEMALQHEEIRIVRHHSNGGVAVARNSIIDTAKGEFIAFFDDDDESAPDRISLQVNRICEYERTHLERGPVICHTARQVLYPDGSVRIEPTMGEQADRPAPRGIAVARRVLLGTPLQNGYGACPTCSQLARTQTYRTLGGFDPTFRRSEDTEFNVRLALADGVFVGIAQPLVQQRMTLSSDKSLDGELDYAIRMLDKHRTVAENLEQYRFARAWLKTRHRWLAGRKRQALWELFLLGLRHPILSTRRLLAATSNLGTNRAFARFHREGHSS